MSANVDWQQPDPRNASMNKAHDAKSADAIQFLRILMHCRPTKRLLFLLLLLHANDSQSAVRSLAHRDWRTALHMLLTMPPRHAVAIWQALNTDTHRALVDEIVAVSHDNVPLVIPDPIAVLIRGA